jgi:hypothetical protein
MVTFTAAMLQTRQTAVVVHLISNLVHLLRLLACFLDCLLAASPRRCRLPVPISLRPFTTFMRFIMTSSICRVPALASSSRPLSKYGREFHSRRHNRSPCFNSIPPCRLHFQRRPSINFILPTPLPTVITLRSPTPLTSVNFFLLFFFSSSSLEHHAAL